MPFDVTLTEEERRLWIDRMAEEVVRRRLEAPAAFMLELNRPLSFLGSQALVVLTPFLGPFFGTDNVLKLSKVFEDRRTVEHLIDRIEVLAVQRATESHSSFVIRHSSGCADDAEAIPSDGLRRRTSEVTNDE